MTHKFIVSCDKNSIDLYNDPYILISSIEGVGAEANVNVTEYSSQAGGIFNGSHEPSRVITVAAKFKKIGDMSAQKKRLYGIFRTGCEISIRYVTPSFDVVTTGYISKCDIPPNNYPLVMSAEIVCPDPYFKQRFAEPVQLFGMSKLFCFKQEGITLNRICFGNSERSKLVKLDYGGDTSAGVVIRIALNADCGGFRIDNFTLGKYIAMSGNFKEGDIIEISTEDGRKYAELTRGGVVSNSLAYLEPRSSMWQLAPGINTIKFSADGLAVTAADVMMYYDIKVGGV